MTEQHPDPDEIVIVLEPEDEYTHEPDEAENYNESMYLNAFDLGLQGGGWFRLGNRVNEGYAEMTVCLYLPDGRVGFIYDRPKIDNNDEMSAGGLTISVVEPFEHLTVEYSGRVCLLDDPEPDGRPAHRVPEQPDGRLHGRRSTTAPCHPCTAASRSTPTDVRSRWRPARVSRRRTTNSTAR